MTTKTRHSRDHGGGIDAAAAQYGGARADWLDLSTGINPCPYPIGDLPADAWRALPDQGAEAALIAAARAFWSVPAYLDILPTHGASAAIARLPTIFRDLDKSVQITMPTYNEWAASFEGAGWTISQGSAALEIYVHPNNPDGRLAPAPVSDKIRIYDESFCDVMPEASHLPKIAENSRDIVLKSFGKFWGLAGLRLGFVIAAPDTIARLRAVMGPWSVSGPALVIGARALRDPAWAEDTRRRLAQDAARLDALMAAAGANDPRGTSLFRLFHVGNAAALQSKLAQHHIWTRIFPYSTSMIRLGLPHAPEDWTRLEKALA